MNFLDLDEQIERNEKSLEFYNGGYQKTLSKFSILTIFYSLMSVYLVQIVGFPFTEFFKPTPWFLVIYIVPLIGFAVFILISIYNAYLILKPVPVAYLENPEFFYKKIKAQYESIIPNINSEKLNNYIKTTYLAQLENCVSSNLVLYEAKSHCYYKALTNGLKALLFYVVCFGFVIFGGKEVPGKIDINNSQQIIRQIDSIIKIKKMEITENPTPVDNTGSAGTNAPAPLVDNTVDPSLVIIAAPRMVKESFNRADLSTLKGTDGDTPAKPTNTGTEK